MIRFATTADMHRAGCLPPSCTRTLGVILELAREGHPITLRGIASVAGFSFAAAQQFVYRLKAAGLVSFEPGLSGTIQPTVRVL